MLKPLSRAAAAAALLLAAAPAGAQDAGGNGFPTMAVPQGGVQGMQGSANLGADPAPPAPTGWNGGVTGSVPTGAGIYGNIDYLLWHVPTRTVKIPLVSTGDINSLGVLGQPATAVLPGNRLNFDGASPGLKIAFGVWWDDAKALGSDFSIMWMFTQRNGVNYQSDGTGNPILSRPFYDQLFGGEDARILALPGVFTGGVAISNGIRLWGAEFNPVLCKIAGDETVSVHALFGFKYLYLNETESITDNTIAQGAAAVSFLGNSYAAGYATSVTDSVVAANRFYGATLGLKTSGEYGRFSFDLTGKIAIGGNEEIVDSYGSTRLVDPSGHTVQAVPGGLLFQQSNSGKFDTYKFAVMPELNASIGVRIVQGVVVSLGYNILYLSSSVRAPDQIAMRNLNSGTVASSANYGIAGPAGPAPYVQRTDFAAQSLSLGLTISY